MKFSEFEKMDPDLAQRIIRNAKEREAISRWQQELRDRLVSGLEKRGISGLGPPVYEDEIRTEYMSLLDQAEAVGNSAMLRIVSHLKNERKGFERNWKECDQLHDEILQKHGLEVAVIVGVDGELEDQFEFIKAE